MPVVLVGRSRELAVIDDLARRLAGGTGGVLAVVGEAGIGKSTLLQQVERVCGERGARARTAVADEVDRRRSAAVVRALLPEMDDQPGEDPVERAVAAAELVAAQGPLVLVADDVHWADDASLDALAALGRRVGQLGVAVAVGARPHPRWPAQIRLEDLAARHGALLEPAPLAAGELAELVLQRLPVHAVGPGLQHLLAETGGNPFLAVELLQALEEAGQLVAPNDDVADVRGATGVPERLSSRLARRALLAVPDADLALRAAAVVAGGATPEELAAVLDRGLTDVLAVVLAAVEAGVLVDHGRALTFRHDLLRRAVLDATPPSVQRALARRAAAVLQARGAADERVALQLVAGCDPTDPADVQALARAGTAMAPRSPAAAADLLAVALDGTADEGERLERTIALAWALARTGRAEEAAAVAASLHRRLGERSPVALERVLAHALGLAGRLAEAAELFDGRLLAPAPSPVPPEAALLVAELALLRLLRGDVAGARGTLVATGLWDGDSGDPGAAAVQHVVRAWLVALEGRLEEGVAAAEAATTFASRAGAQDVAQVAQVHVVAAVMHEACGVEDVARQRLRRADAEATVGWVRPLVQFTSAVTAYRTGRWDDALADVQAGLVATEESGLGLGAGYGYAVAALIAVHRGALPEAEAWLARGRETGAGEHLGGYWLVHAAARAARAAGRDDEALLLWGLLAEGAVGLDLLSVLLLAGPDAVRTTLAQGEPERAQALAAAADELRRRSQAVTVRAASSWMAGLVLAAGPTPADGLAAVVEAADTLSAVRAPEAALARHDAAVVAARMGDAALARRLAAAAFATYDELGAEHDRSRLRAELRAAGVVVRPPRREVRPASGWESLTTTEQQVVALVAHGGTNTEIAGRLYMSRRTVESHLGRVYAKLGVATRTQLASLAARRLG